LGVDCVFGDLEEFELVDVDFGDIAFLESVLAVVIHDFVSQG
jgi:hypothetical protein